MKIKEKKCKGAGKAKGFNGCGKMTLWRKYGLCTSCYADFILNTDVGRIILEKAQIKASRPRMELEQAERDMKNRKNLTTLINSAVTVFHKYIRERDKYKPCIACGTQWKSDFHASHFFKAELYSSLKFDDRNVHAGCIECNIRKEGNINKYSQNLPLRIGNENYNEIISLADQEKKFGHKWERDKLIELRKYYNFKLKT